MTSIVARLSHELQANSWQVQAAVDLLDEGSSVPFIARYRKEATGALDDVQLRKLEERLRYLRELDERRKAVLESIDAQGKLTDVLKKSLLEADNKARLEDIYLPFKPKRRTKAQLAIEAGLAPLASAATSVRSHNAIILWTVNAKAIVGCLTPYAGHGEQKLSYIFLLTPAQGFGVLQKMRPFASLLKT